MPNQSIPDWKKATIVAMSCKYGDRAMGKRLNINKNTVRKYRQQAQNEGRLEMSGPDLVVNK